MIEVSSFTYCSTTLTAELNPFRWGAGTFNKILEIIQLLVNSEKKAECMKLKAAPEPIIHTRKEAGKIH